VQKRVDKNQTELVKIYRQLGCSMTDLSEVGKGCPDYLVGVAGVSCPVEFKNGKLSPSRRKLTDAQVEWHDEWQGSVWIVDTAEKVVEHVKWLRARGARNGNHGIVDY